MKQEKAPPLGEQLENILTFVVKMSEWETKVDSVIGALPIGPPACEMSKKPVKYIYGEDSSSVRTLSNWEWGIKVKDYKGNEQNNCRDCPYCGHRNFSTAAIGQVIGCLKCSRSYAW